jgi:hypothetical protein
MRSREEIAYMLDWLTKEQHRLAGGPAYQRGGLELLRWTLGKTATAPITGRQVSQPVDRSAVNDEGYEAQTAMYNGGRTPVGTLSHQFLLGVEAYSIWITGGDSLALPQDWPYPDEALPAPGGRPESSDARRFT